MTDSPLSQALAHLVRQGDMGEVRKFLYQIQLLDYNLAHDVRMSGHHMAPTCLLRDTPCIAFPDFEVWDKA